MDHINYKPATFEDGSQGFEFGAETVVHSNYLNPVTLFLEADLFSEWVPNLKDCEIISEQGEFRKLVHWNIKCPFPLSDRDIMMDWFGWILPEEEALWTIVKSEKRYRWFGENVFEPEDGIVRIDIKNCFSYMKILNEEETLLKFVMSVDIKLDFVPDWLLNYWMSKGVAKWLNNIRKLWHNFKGTRFEKRQIERPIYRYIQKRIEEDKDC